MRIIFVLALPTGNTQRGTAEETNVHIWYIQTIYSSCRSPWNTSFSFTQAHFKTKSTLFLPLCIFVGDVGKTSERWMRVSRSCLLWPLSKVPACTQPAKPPCDECVPAPPLGEKTSLKSVEGRRNSGVILEIFILIEWFEFVSATYPCSVIRVVIWSHYNAPECDTTNIFPDSIFLLYTLWKNETWYCMSVYKTILFLIRLFFTYFYCIYWG